MTSFKKKLGPISYNACLAITGAIRSTSKEKIYEELTGIGVPSRLTVA